MDSAAKKRQKLAAALKRNVIRRKQAAEYASRLREGEELAPEDRAPANDR